MKIVLTSQIPGVKDSQDSPDHPLRTTSLGTSSQKRASLCVSLVAYLHHDISALAESR